MITVISQKTLVSNVKEVTISIVNKENEAVVVRNNKDEESLVIISLKEYDRLTGTKHVVVKPTEVPRSEYVIDWNWRDTDD